MGSPRSLVRPATAAIAVALLAGAAMLAVALTADGAGGAGHPDRGERAARPGLHAFSSCDRLRAYLHRHERQIGARSVTGGPMVLEDAAALPAAVAPSASESVASGGAPSAAGSPTNVQEEGVDEPDIVKVSGRTAFVVDGGRLRSVDLSGAAPAVLDSLALPGHGPAAVDEAELLLSGERALVISRSYAESAETVISEIEVGEPSALRVARTMTVEGWLVSARASGSSVRMVLSSQPEVPAADRRSRRAILPRAVLRDRVAGTRAERRLYGCDAVRRPSRFSGGTLLSVLTLDIERGLTVADADAILSGGEVVYASPANLYVASERWLAPDASPARASAVKTQIHRFDTSEASTTTYAGSGSVEGFMLNQWSMSEHEGVLRVASTSAPPWLAPGPQSRQAESESSVTTLAPAGDRLVRLGRVGGLGRSERIYAVRFIGEVGYVVTFRQVDPLYTLDLSDPSHPRVAGELKIPGYSAYLHPVGPGLILGVGQEATAEGATTGVQVSLFDVTDPAAPRRVDRVGLGYGTHSEVESDHHAFAFSERHSLAVIPFADVGLDGAGFNGAAGLRVSAGEGALSRLGRTAHGSSYVAAIRRSIELDGRLYTISAKGIAEHDPETLTRLSLTRFAGP